MCCTSSCTYEIMYVLHNVQEENTMDNVITPTQGRKEFFKLIKKVNDDKQPVMVKPTKAGEKGAVVVGEDDWKAIQETLFLVNQGVDKQIKERENDEDEDFDKVVLYRLLGEVKYFKEYSQNYNVERNAVCLKYRSQSDNMLHYIEIDMDGNVLQNTTCSEVLEDEDN